MSPTESRILEAMDGPMTRQDIADKLGLNVDCVRDYVRHLENYGCITCVGMRGKRKVYESTGKRPNVNKTLGFTVFGVRI